MLPTQKLPVPILLNCLKHHLGFIVYRIKNLHEKSESISRFADDLKQIGQSRIDLYTGALDTLEISEQIIELLRREHHFTRQQYQQWISDGRKRYQLMQLSDDSFWTFLKGDDSHRYVHIHPARNGKHTLSVNANGIKTAIAVVAAAQTEGGDPMNLEPINQIRVELLELPPLKKFFPKKGLGTLISLLHSRAKGHG